MRPVRVIVPYPAGGVVVMARAVTVKLASDLGQPFVVEARPGAGTNIARGIRRQRRRGRLHPAGDGALPDQQPLVETGLRWKPADFTPVARYAAVAEFHPGAGRFAPARSARLGGTGQSATGLPGGDGGTGSTRSRWPRRCWVRWVGIRYESIGYKGAPAGDPRTLINGVISMSIIPSTVAIPQVLAGKLRALANTGDKRSPCCRRCRPSPRPGFRR